MTVSSVRFVTKLYWLFGALLAVGAIGMSLALWGVHEAQHNLARTDLAHRSYQAYLSLSNHTYQLFKEFGDAMTIGDRDHGALEHELIAAIRGDVSTIRDILASEIKIEGDTEVPELAHLARIEAQIEDLLEEYQAVLDMGYAIGFSDEWGRLSTILDKRVDQDFKQLIQAALEGQHGELVEQQALTRTRIKLYRWLTVLVILLGAGTAGAALWWLVRDLKEPVDRLIQGARALARGDRDHRIAALGGSELASVARAFNRMANEIAGRERALEASNQGLELAVAERTAELERLLAALKATEADRRRLLADVSHELRTPLTIIRGEADIALRGGDKAPAVYREALERSREAAEHTSRLVDDLLFIARRESGEVRLKTRELDLVTLLPAVIATCRSMEGGRGVSVVFRTELGAALTAADPDRLRQVLVILLDNALRYGGRHVEVRLDRGAAGHVIIVSDDGPGLSADDLAQAFKRFYRGTNAAERYHQGTGLGLTVAKAIVEAHKGEIAIDSQPDHGVRVTVMLPDVPRLRLAS